MTFYIVELAFVSEVTLLALLNVNLDLCKLSDLAKMQFTCMPSITA